MELLRIDPEHPDGAALNAIAEAVLRGGVVAFPTDTLYGLGCSLFDVSAVELLARLKRRDPSLAVISLIPEPGQVYGLASEVNETAERLMRQFWPGPLSLIFKASSIVPVRVRGAGGTIALRCPSAGRWCRAARTSPASRRPAPPRTWCGCSAASSIWWWTAARGWARCPRHWWTSAP